MEHVDLLRYTASINSQIYSHWEMFIAVHVALLSGLFAFNLNIKFSFKILFITFYFVFALINLFVSLNLMNHVDAAVLDLQILISDRAPTNLESYISGRNVLASKAVLYGVHLFSAVLVVLGVFTTSRKQTVNDKNS